MQQRSGKVLVVGAGVAGIRTALDLAEYGHGVVLIDKAPSIGGVLNQLDRQFPSNHCGMCRMLPLLSRDSAVQHCLRRGFFHENIDIRLSTELLAVEGQAGRFQVQLGRKPQLIDPDRCQGCGVCVETCPVSIPDEFNAGLAERKAIYCPVPHRSPRVYVIDTEACTRCGACQASCPFDAIRMTAPERQNFRILIVDDELVMRDSLKEWMADEGFAVEMAASGPEALAMLGEKAYQMMLLDIKMPGQDGVSVLECALSDYPDLCVVMMTAYATVETAVAAMKMGARDYLMKPFNPEELIPKVVGLYEEMQSPGRQVEKVGAIVLAGGVSYFTPGGGEGDPFGYSRIPNVVTNLEFERIISGVGPYGGQLRRPGDGKPVDRIAWIQCVGSRDVQCNADYCSSICCMIALKEAMLVKSASGGKADTAVYYMDMRTFEKTFQRYLDRAKQEQIRFIRGRVHSLYPDDVSRDVIVRCVDECGIASEERFQLIVLSVGQRPAEGLSVLTDIVGIPLNDRGFPQTRPFSLSLTEKEGILLGGTFSGTKGIGEALIQAGSASLCASRILHKTPLEATEQASAGKALRDAALESPQIHVIVGTCSGSLIRAEDQIFLERELKKDPVVAEVVFCDHGCRTNDWDTVLSTIDGTAANRILLATCAPDHENTKVHALAEAAKLERCLVGAVHLSHAIGERSTSGEQEVCLGVQEALAAIRPGVIRLKYAFAIPPDEVAIQQQALVVGGGVAGITAALAVAEHGYSVHVVEREAAWGGNLAWLSRTLEGHTVGPFFDDLLKKASAHPLVHLHLETWVVDTGGEAGDFRSTLENGSGEVTTVKHGVCILATGGTEAGTNLYGYGKSPRIVTQRELSRKLDASEIRPEALSSVVMIQCVGSREEPRNYCSRVCCSTAVKHALQLKEANPEMQIYVLYRDMMTYGFSESFYTRARQSGVLFIRYRLEELPEVILPESGEEEIRVRTREPVVGKMVEIEADLVVLATGVVPAVAQPLAGQLGIETDRDGFYQEADSKWRPVDTMKEGVFVCGLGRAPCSVAEAAATAEAASERALRILGRSRLQPGRVVARLKQSLCSLCLKCIDVCAYHARVLDQEQGKIRINAAACQGCGACAAACPSKAAVVDGFPVQQMFGLIDAAIEGMAG